MPRRSQLIPMLRLAGQLAGPRPSWRWGVAALLVAVGYFLLFAPAGDEASDWPLPDLSAAGSASESANATVPPASATPSSERASDDTTPSTSAESRFPSDRASSAEVPAAPASVPTEPSEAATTADPRQAAAESSPQSELSQLMKRIGPDLFESPAGLIYGRGSKEGHRLKHLMTHARDNPDRPGQHGVFDDSQAVEVVTLVDEAYERARAGRRTDVRREQSRTIYTVDMGRRIGYVGGEVGNRRRRPAAHHIRLVLEDKRVITAFPIRVNR